MSEQIGKLVTCDRCGVSIHLKAVVEKEMDGGWTRWTEFDPRPDGWTDVYAWAPKTMETIETHTLCPACGEMYSALWSDIVAKVRAFMDAQTKREER